MRSLQAGAPTCGSPWSFGNKCGWEWYLLMNWCRSFYNIENNALGETYGMLWRLAGDMWLQGGSLAVEYQPEWELLL